MSTCPVKISQQPDGSYRWSDGLDMDVERKNYRMGGLICMMGAFVLFVAGAIISVFSRSWQPVLYMAVFSIIVLLITIGVVRGQESMGQRRRTYRLMDGSLPEVEDRQQCLNSGRRRSCLWEKDLWNCRADSAHSGHMCRRRILIL